MSRAASLEALIAAGRDSAPLRFALANCYLADDDLARALEHAKLAVELDADYSAAWKLLGRIQAAAGLDTEAATTYKKGIEVAEKKGDRQAAREMHVFLKRLQRPS